MVFEFKKYSISFDVFNHDGCVEVNITSKYMCIQVILDKLM